MRSPGHEEFIGVQPRLLLRLLPYFRPHSGLVIGGVFLALLVNFAVLTKPWIIKHVIDEFITKPGTDSEAILWFGLVYFGVVLVGGALAWTQSMLMAQVGQTILSTLRQQVFRHIERKQVPFFDRNSTGRLLTRVTTDIEALGELFSGVFVNMIRDSLMVVGIVVVLFSLDVRLAWVALGCVPCLVLSTWVYRWAARKNFRRIKGMISRINGFLAENITGMKLVQIFHREKEKEEELRNLDREYVRYSLLEVVLNSFSRPLVDAINNLTIAALLVVCIGGTEQPIVAAGVLYAFISYVRQFFEPIGAIAEQYTTIQSGMVSAARIFDILDATDESEDLESGLPVPPLRGEIEFRGVWFAYHGEHWVLRDVSFSVAAGEHVALVGSTGSGKSTVIALLTRWYQPQRGSILIDGVDVRFWRLDQLRRRIGVVMQDVFLFSGPLSENLSLGQTDVDEVALRAAAALVQAERVIDRLPDSWQSILTERGHTLSAGERQILSFARAVVGSPSILVLDEATATIDTATEQALQEGLSRLSAHRTVLIIAHRLSTIRDCDRIFVFGGGGILESGTHDNLMRNLGPYSRMCRSQIPSLGD